MRDSFIGILGFRQKMFEDDLERIVQLTLKNLFKQHRTYSQHSLSPKYSPNKVIDRLQYAKAVTYILQQTKF